MSIFNHFKHLTFSPDQQTALEKLETFLNSSTQVFILKGYAGSGKTTILKGLVEYLGSIEKDFALMAPTGRAAKVIREKTGQEAYTIHKTIYSYDEMVEVEEGDSFFYYYKIRNNADVHNKVFIVDEASMLSDSKSEGEFFRFGTSHLLSDLISYTRVTSDTAQSKIIFVGDPCQLAPIGDNSSRALDANYLKDKFHLSIEEAEMKEVKRQQGESGILKAAAKIRKSISSGFFNDFSLRENGKDIFNPSYEAFLDTWQRSASPKIIIASKNKTCLDLNLQIRERKYGDANLPIQKGDIVIIGGNNYRKGVFNGEFAVVSEIAEIAKVKSIKFYRKAGTNTFSDKAVTQEVTLTWRSVELAFPDTESNNKIVKGQVLENFLYGDNFLNPDEMQALYVDFKNRHPKLKPGSEEFKEAIINDEYFHCLLLKYGYAVTCHKAQGGEWSNVFTVWDHENQKDFDCYRDNQIRRSKDNEGFYRWAYTALTRASKTLFALNSPYFNSYSSMSFIGAAVTNSLNELTGQQIQSEEMSLDNELLDQLTQFGLLEQPIQIQDHFIKLLHVISKQYIGIVGWERKGYEVRYKFQRDKSFVTGKTSINIKNEFKNSLLYIASLSNDQELFTEIEKVWKNLPDISIKRNTAETIISKIDFDLELEERFPFTKNLFEDLESVLGGRGIVIDDIDHQQYKERYTFKRDVEMLVLDFEYKKNGFFGRVVPVLNKTNSRALLDDVQTALQIIKQKEDAS